MATKQEISVTERGNIYFFYRPKIEQEEVEGVEDVQRFYLVLSPHGRKRYRRIALGRKKLPEVEEGGDRTWGFVDMVVADPKEIEEAFAQDVYQTKTRGERREPAARPAGEGVYALGMHGDHTHLLYALELPEKRDQAQKDLRIEEEGSYVITVRNPEAPAPPSAGLGRGKRADFPEELRNRFRDRKFAPVDPVDFLDHEGAELLLVAAERDISRELGLELDTQEETERTAEVFSDLRIKKTEHPLEPLFHGTWK